jgi:acetolactate synthase I/II/III large subunit
MSGGIETVAEHYLAGLRARGIERLFFNAGTDFAPLVEAYARCYETIAPPFPAPILATHENLAIGMAHGAYLVTGQPQAVMVHVSVGTANAICGLMNAARGSSMRSSTARSASRRRSRKDRSI